MKVGQRPSPVEVGREPFINQRQQRRRRRQQQLESLYGLLSVDYMRRAVPGSVFLGGHGSAYGRHALLTLTCFTVVSCNGARVQAEARMSTLGTYAEARVGRLQPLLQGLGR